jgi:hypothetical protein
MFSGHGLGKQRAKENKAAAEAQDSRSRWELRNDGITSVHAIAAELSKR